MQSLTKPSSSVKTEMNSIIMENLAETHDESLLPPQTPISTVTPVTAAPLQSSEPVVDSSETTETQKEEEEFVRIILI